MITRYVSFINFFLFRFDPCPPVQSLKIGNIEVQGSPDILYTHHRINESERKVEKPRITAVCKVLAMLVSILIQYLKFEFDFIFRVFTSIFRQKLLILINLYVPLLENTYFCKYVSLSYRLAKTFISV